jgi:quercetin 2,3-dioxygenase
LFARSKKTHEDAKRDKTMKQQAPTIDVRRSAVRDATKITWLDSKHSFSFGSHYDPKNVGHGLLLVNNDDRVAPGMGFQTHPHRDMEIVTWVLSGELEHKDSQGNKGLLYPGLAQRMTAGRGILHSEINGGSEEVHFIQMWVLPDTAGVDPTYEQIDINDQLRKGGLVPIASGRPSDAGAIRIRQRNAVLFGGRLQPGETVKVPDDQHVHVFVPVGSANLDGAGDLHTGDAARLVTAGAPALTAGPDGAEVLIWATRV